MRRESAARAHWWTVRHAVAIGTRLRGSLAATTLVSDLRFALRDVTRSRTFTTAAVLTLTVGLGVNVSVADAILFKPLPYGGPASETQPELASVERRRAHCSLLGDAGDDGAPCRRQHVSAARSLRGRNLAERWYV
jgi:hypothetical protein